MLSSGTWFTLLLLLSFFVRHGLNAFVVVRCAKKLNLKPRMNYTLVDVIRHAKKKTESNARSCTGIKKENTDVTVATTHF